MLRNAMPDFEQSARDAAATAANIKVEPWMKGFIEQRHTQEEWDAFFAYCHAGSWKRRLIRWTSVAAALFR